MTRGVAFFLLKNRSLSSLVVALAREVMGMRSAFDSGIFEPTPLSEMVEVESIFDGSSVNIGTKKVHLQYSQFQKRLDRVFVLLDKMKEVLLLWKEDAKFDWSAVPESLRKRNLDLMESLKIRKEELLAELSSLNSLAFSLEEEDKVLSSILADLKEASFSSDSDVHAFVAGHLLKRHDGIKDYLSSKGELVQPK